MSAAAVDQAFARGGRISQPALTLIVSPQNSGAGIRLSVVVGKKIFRDAVRRNRLRRILRESFRLTAPCQAAADFVLVAKEAARSFKTRQDADAVMRKLLKT